jgi:hypothetical protein
MYIYILSPLLGDKCVYREHIKIPEQWGNLLGYVAFTGSKWGSLGDLPALAMATINGFKKITHLDTLSLSSLFLFFAWVIWTQFKMGIYQPNLLHHGSGRGVDIDTTWTNLTQSGVGQDSLPKNLDGLHIPKDNKNQKNVSSISHCEMSFMWVPTGCGFLGGKSELFRTEVSKYHGSW